MFLPPNLYSLERNVIFVVFLVFHRYQTGMPSIVLIYNCFSLNEHSRILVESATELYNAVLGIYNS